MPLRQVHAFELVSESFELECRSYAEHHFHCTGEDVECHSALRFYLFVAYEVDSGLGHAANHHFNILSFLAVERQSDDITYDVFIHVVKSIVTVVGFVFRLLAFVPVFVPSVGYGHAEVCSPCYRYGRIILYLRYSICHVFWSKIAVP